ncbi:MAG: ABC transporter ATP-binding protein [Clostridia bacterium]|nr:ABC transporter ATP-binding protein [Clostridia bacterium]
MKQVLSYLKFYRKQVVLAPLFKLLEALLELAVPLVVAAIVDKGIPSGDKGYILAMFFLLFGLGLVGLLSSVTAQYFAARAAVGHSTRLRRSLFEKMQSLSFAEVDKLGAANMISRMTGDVNQVQTGVNMVLRLFLRSPFIVFGAVIMAFFVDVPSGMVFAVALPVLTLIVVGIMAITLPLYKRSQEKLDGLLLSTRENLTGARVLRAFCKEGAEIAAFDRKNVEYTKRRNFVGSISAAMNPLTYAVVNAAIIALLYVGGIRVDSGLLTQGQVLALYNYMSQILIELIKLANLIVTITKSIASAHRIEEVFSLSNPLKTSADATVYTDNAVDFQNVCLSYAGGGNALENITFSVKKGQTVGIIGGTGSGKTSLVRLISHFYDPTEGTVLVNGVNVQAQNTQILREKVATVLQKSVLFEGTVRENIRWGNPAATDEQILHAVALAQATDVVNSKGGLDGKIEQKGANLSGGQKQRLSIARALVKNPEILILDDSSSALDYATDAALRKALATLPKTTTFIVSQRTASLQHADIIVVLDEGKMVGLGTHAQLLNSCEVYREIYQSQFKEVHHAQE